MPGLGTFLVKVRRGETPFYRFLNKTARASLQVHVPIPRPVKPVFRGLYHTHFLMEMILLPDVASHIQLHLGNNVHLNGFFGAGSGRLTEAPRLEFQDNVHVGHMCNFAVNKEIVIEEGVMIANYCYFADSDSHPVEPHLRVAGLPPSIENVKPIRICRNAWIGHGVHVMKGVTVGEGAVVAAGSVVVKDVPPFSVVAGNPARVVVANVLEGRSPDTKIESSRQTGD
jgi:acetyltransferase-like isoleucine patch superfamily enzyme